jgi:hypothetical protein
MLLDSLDLDASDLAERAGWQLKPEGACKGDVCVPLPEEARTSAAGLAQRLGMPVLHDEAHGVWAVGPSSASGRALDTAEAPELVLPDLDGKPFALSSLRGKRVVLAAWASW